jgi:hypothetical protein
VRQLALIPALATGCFYVDTINQRPSIAIDLESSDPVKRGSIVMMHAEVDDPEGQNAETQVQWNAYLCTDATDPGTCDMDVAFYSADTRRASFQVPSLRADHVTPVQSVLVTLDATDPGGAKAKTEQLIIPVGNTAPDIKTMYTPRKFYVVGTKIQIFAAYGDFDDGPQRVTLTEPWPVTTPDVTATFTLDVVADPQQDPNDPTHIYVQRTLTTGQTTSNAGMWIVQLIATDPLGAQAQYPLSIDVQPDEPPCIASVAPIVPPSNATLPVFQPTLFQVPVVTDDLDVYPPQNDPDLGVTTFAWTIKPPGSATRLPFGTGNSVDFDPAAFQHNDLVDIRVEITDRFPGRTVNCPDADDTCSISPDPNCIQRQTWHVEVQ